ncbi:MAG: hypothetical protein IKS55_06590 [Oscillospiraceae bacterium]|nr:hypothetical protein [Oscillospiraceae bacterium]
MSEDVLEKVYQERLEEQLIAFLAKEENLSLEKAMDIYYSSRLSEKIHEGMEGVQYLDYKVLVQILRETEPELF